MFGVLNLSGLRPQLLPAFINPPTMQDRHKREEKCRHYDVRHLSPQLSCLRLSVPDNRGNKRETQLDA